MVIVGIVSARRPRRERVAPNPDLVARAGMRLVMTWILQVQVGAGCTQSTPRCLSSRCYVQVMSRGPRMERVAPNPYLVARAGAPRASWCTGFLCAVGQTPVDGSTNRLHLLVPSSHGHRAPFLGPAGFCPWRSLAGLGFLFGLFSRFVFGLFSRFLGARFSWRCPSLSPRRLCAMMCSALILVAWRWTMEYW